MPADATPWERADLDLLAAEDEIGIASTRPDGTLRPFVVIWGVVADGGVYVRSAYGPGNGWFRRAVASGTGAVRVAGRVLPVAFSSPEDGEHAAVDAAYLEKYAGYPSIVRGIVGPSWHPVTLRLDPLPGG